MKSAEIDIALPADHKLGPSQHTEPDNSELVGKDFDTQRTSAAPPSEVDGYSLAVNLRFLLFMLLSYGMGFC
jgi:hypothetical protein